MHKVYLLFFSLFLCLPTWLEAAPNAEPSLDEQRQWFEQAHVALKQKNMSEYHMLYKQLQGYPLRPYLDIWYAQQQVKSGNDSFVTKALNTHEDIPETIDLRVAWVKQLSKQERWGRIATEFTRFHKLSSYLKEISLLSKWHSGQKEQAIQSFSLYWMKHKETPKELRAIENAWHKDGHPTEQEYWDKITSAVKHGKWASANKLAKNLDPKASEILKRWQAIQRDPEKNMQAWALSDVQDPLKNIVLNDGFNRLSRKGAQYSWNLLEKIRLSIDNLEVEKLERKIALRAAKQHLPEAAQWLESLANKNNQTWAWQTRILLMQQNWKKALTVIDSMPKKQQHESRWVYWKARILEENGHKDAAHELYQNLAESRGYYSFLSSERIKQTYHIVTQHYDVDHKSLEAFAATPGVIRTNEWIKLGKNSKALREWMHVLRGTDKNTWLAAMYTASDWMWHGQAIRAAWRGGAVNALEKRFPLAYNSAIDSAAIETNLDKSLILSVIRQESAFNAYAQSHAGARGLMQLMPKTAKYVARKHHLKMTSQDLFSPKKNIRLGSFYLAEMQKKFDGNLAMVLASYNAGPHRVTQWNKRILTDDTVLWVELIPFNETRRYVQQIMAFIKVYDWRQQQNVAINTATTYKN